MDYILVGGGGGDICVLKMLFIVQTIVIFKDFMLTTCLKYPMGLFFWRGGGGGGKGGLYMEEVFRFKSWFLNAPGLYRVGLIIGILRYPSLK